MYRPDNQTFILMLVIGLGVMLITTLYNIQNLLLDQVSLAGSGAQPNTILFDIQASQKDEVARLVRKEGLPIIQEVPIVTMRLESIDGRSKMQADTTIPEWVFDREYRSSYRDTLIDTETIIDGKWHTEMPKDGQVYVSLSDRVSKPMHAEVGTRLVFNVQGVPVEAVVSSIRKVDFNRVQTNFFVVFPSGILEKAPQFYVVVSKTNNPTEAAALQRKVVGQFPNVSFIDLTQILKTAETILNKVTFVIRFMASFSILTGLLVLIGSIFLSRRQRIKESILLRTLGASSQTVILINAIEYFLLGITASLTGIILAIATTFVLSKWVFSVPFSMDIKATAIICIALSLITMILGWLGARGLLKKSPLEVLRNIN
jgi:putative ABC transport system permease protein